MHILLFLILGCLLIQLFPSLLVKFFPHTGCSLKGLSFQANPWKQTKNQVRGAVVGEAMQGDANTGEAEAVGSLETDGWPF